MSIFKLYLQNKKMTLAKTESSAVMIQNKVNVVSSKIEFLSAKKPIFEAKIKEIRHPCRTRQLMRLKEESICSNKC